MENRETYLKQLQDQLDEWYAEIEILKQDSVRVDHEQREDYAERIGRLQSQCEVAEKGIARIREAQDGAWEELRDGAEHMWSGLKQLFDDTKTAFQEGRREANKS